jgi:hypothetical protein
MQNNNTNTSDAPKDEPYIEEVEYRNLTLCVWRTDDPMEPPEDNEDAEGPFETGDWYFAVKDWNLQGNTSAATFRQALEQAKHEVDKALSSGATPQANDNWLRYR